MRAVASGALPLWDPSPAFGQPLLADPGAQVLYPPTWLNLLMRPVGLLHALRLRATSCCPGSRSTRSRGAGGWRRVRPSPAPASGCCRARSSPSWTSGTTSRAPPGSPPSSWRRSGRSGRAAPATSCSSASPSGCRSLAGSGDVCALTLAALAGWMALVHLGPGRWQETPAPAGRRRRRPRGGRRALRRALARACSTSPSRSGRRELPEEVRTYWSVHPVAVARDPGRRGPGPPARSLRPGAPRSSRAGIPSSRRSTSACRRPGWFWRPSPCPGSGTGGALRSPASGSSPAPSPSAGTRRSTAS